jgi:hypothetical protein
METYYKVVLRNNEGQLVSPLTSQAWQVQYEPNRWVEAPIGKLFVFSSKGQAIQLSDAITMTSRTATSTDGLSTLAETWEVAAEDVEERFAIPIFESDFSQFWAGVLPRAHERPLASTLVAKRVMLLRRLFAV